MSELLRWLDTNGVTQVDLMKQTGLSWSTIYRAVHAKRDLNLSAAIRICVATRGEVPVASLSKDAELLHQLEALRAQRVRHRRRRTSTREEAAQ